MLIEREQYGFAEASKRLGIAESVLRRWHQRYGAASAQTPPSAVSQEVLAENRRLKQEVRRLQMERDILKKATAFFAKESL